MAAALSPPQYFLPSAGRPPVPWRVWARMFHNYLSASDQAGLPENRKKAILIHLLGSEGQSLLFSLRGESAGNFSYREIIETFDKHFGDSKNHLSERMGFSRRFQEPSESVSDFYVALSSLATTCEFGDFFESSMRDQFVRGLADPRIRERLLQEDFGLDGCLQMARRMEDGLRVADSMNNSSLGKSRFASASTVVTVDDNCHHHQDGMTPRANGGPRETKESSDSHQPMTESYLEGLFQYKNLGVDELGSLDLYRGVLGEFVACFFFLCSVLVANSSSNGNLSNIAFTFGINIAILVQIFGGISGAHINSAVSVGMLVAGRCSLARCCFYVIAQVVGSILGVGFVWAVMPDRDNSGGLGVVSPAVGAGWALLLECLFTGLLLLQVLVCTDPRRPPGPQTNIALSVGLTVLLAHFILVPLTGCGINPSRATGSAVVAGELEHLWMYWIGPLIASLAVPPLYELVLAGKK